MRIGVDLGGTNIRAGIIDRNAIIKKLSEPCKAEMPEQAVLGQLKEIISALMPPGVESIGIGVPSVVDAERGIVYNVANIPSWKEIPLKSILEEAFQIPVMVNNDCNCFALGEYHFGLHRQYRNIVCITLGTGVGAGIIIDGKLYAGNNTGAGEIGSLPYLRHDYEYYCSSRFFLHEHGITGKDAYERTCAGDRSLLPLWNEIGNHLGALMKAILYTYDPEAIVMGGSISNAFRFFSAKMYESLQSFPYPATIERIKIMVSKDEDSALLGAAAL
ncbi:MAG: ROK family protein [Prevotellaceae bacterium]|jgi:glucokinase|nr:ROK family protein [Prevotellaceae bacterium]